MKSRQIRISVDVLIELEKKLISEGAPAALVKADLAHYITATLWSYVEGKLKRESK